MSLTEESYRERKWGAYPALRKVLEDKQVPYYYYGPTSAHDNMFDYFGRLIEIVVLVEEYQVDIRKKLGSVECEELYQDLRRLEDSLEKVSHFVKENIQKIQKLRML
jgi:hypothetical protein